MSYSIHSKSSIKEFISNLDELIQYMYMYIENWQKIDDNFIDLFAHTGSISCTSFWKPIFQRAPNIAQNIDAEKNPDNTLDLSAIRDHV